MGMEYWINRKIGAKKSCSKKTLLQEIKSAWNDGVRKSFQALFVQNLQDKLQNPLGGKGPDLFF